MKRTLIDFIEKEKPTKVSRNVNTVSQFEETSTSSNEQSLATRPLLAASSNTSSCSAIDRRHWVRDIHQDEGIEVFVLHTDGGILCLLCNKHKTQGAVKIRRVIQISCLSDQA